MAMWSMIRETHSFTDQKLLERIREIDLSDGHLDGKVQTKTVQKCPQCGKTMSMRHRQCLYCGGEKLTQTAFDAL